MKSFEDWFMDQGSAAEQDATAEDHFLRCCRCGEWFSAYSFGLTEQEALDCAEADDFYCGGSPRCCP